MISSTLRDLVFILLPSGIVLFVMYLTVKAFLNKELELRILEMKGKNTETVLPIRLQAYERMCLFLERIAPNNLLLRLNNNAFSAKDFQQVLLSEIREEYGHNLSQQVYMSDQAWGAIKGAMEEVIMLINTSSVSLPDEAASLDLARTVFDNIMSLDLDPTGKALKVVKDEIRQVF